MAEGFFRFFSKDHFPLMISHDVYDQKCKISKRNRNRERERDRNEFIELENDSTIFSSHKTTNFCNHDNMMMMMMRSTRIGHIIHVSFAFALFLCLFACKL